MTEKTLYVSDMDGTLLGNDSLVSPRTAELISDLSRRGALITVATARTPATVDPLLASTFTRCPAIVMTGAAQWNRNTRSLINPHLLSPQAATEIARSFHNVGLDPFIYTVANPSHLDVYHGIEMNRSEDDFYQARRHLTLKQFHIGQKPSTSENERTILCFDIGPTEHITELASMLSTRDDCSFTAYPDIFSPTLSDIEVLAPGVSKAAAVKELAAQLGADRIVVFGDNLNDLSMLAVADVAVAVGNAQPEVKDAADIVIGPNSADSVALFIEKDFTR